MDSPTHFSVKESKKDTLHMIRMFNTNIDGRLQIIKALGVIRGIGDRFAYIVIRKAGIESQRRAGELSQDEQQKLIDIMSNPTAFGIPNYFLNHEKDFSEGTNSHLISNQLDTNLRFLVERGRKTKHVRQCRLAAGLKVRGQRTKSNGRNGGKLSSALRQK
ncbi:40S ribosomal protein S18 [Cucumispora dikerogammari]|nr:40S ribosomal protein S18 [Cucumispora dikerogammari]